MVSRISRRHTFIATASHRDARGSLPVTIELEITDYKGDLPLNPDQWCKLMMTETKISASGRTIKRQTPIMLNKADRAKLIAYLS